MKLYCATGNPGKLREFQLAAGQSPVQVEAVPGFADLTQAEETGATFEENAILKALHYGAHAPGWLFADDSGLEVDALGDAPGVFSARFAGPGATDQANNELLLERLRGVGNRSARFVCVIALVDRTKVLATFRGTVDGRILQEPRGPNGFGYDPLFFYPPFGCSFGEVPSDQKLTVSHRGQALRSLFQHLTLGGGGR
ncbi:MAG: RdgB/HAM1 family non-canonical purine NTP pyrophosphatase [Bryobacteraceae bacterium]